MKTHTHVQRKPHQTALGRLCLLLAAGLILGSPRSAQAADQVPFKAAFTTVVHATPDFPWLYLEVLGEGLASHLGQTVTFTDNQVVNLLTGDASATYTLVAANGDQIVTEGGFDVSFLADGVTFEGTFRIVGGTGRFAGATGGGALQGAAYIISETEHSGWFELTGTISPPGAKPGNAGLGKSKAASDGDLIHQRKLSRSLGEAARTV